MIITATRLLWTSLTKSKSYNRQSTAAQKTTEDKPSRKVTTFPNAMQAVNEESGASMGPTFKFLSPVLCSVLFSTGLAACGGYTTVDLGGRVTGLTEDGLVLYEDFSGQTIVVPVNAKSYLFPNQIPYKGNYAIRTLSGPLGVDCSISKYATGMATGVPIYDVNVSCQPKISASESTGDMASKVATQTDQPTN